jgi:Zn finger protein HypA/HybF involved in hydrogenase expression
MDIIDVRWDFKVNMLKIKCYCGEEYEHRADRWKMQCPKCGKRADLFQAREEYARRNNKV